MSRLGGTSTTARVAVLVPARNEEEALPSLLAGLQRAVTAGPLEIVVVDNGSTDRTAEVAAAAGARVVPEPRPGYGQACQAGLRALAFGPAPPDVVVFLDADDHLAPSQLGTVLQPILDGRTDLVIGERQTLEGRGVRAHAALGNRLVSVALGGLYGSPTRDMGPFRAVRWECLHVLALDDPNYGWYVQMQVRALRAGFRVSGIPVAFRRRIRGRSKISGSLVGSAAAGWVMLRTLAREVLRAPPERNPYRSAAGR